MTDVGTQRNSKLKITAITYVFSFPFLPFHIKSTRTALAALKGLWSFLQKQNGSKHEAAWFLINGFIREAAMTNSVGDSEWGMGICCMQGSWETHCWLGLQMSYQCGALQLCKCWLTEEDVFVHQVTVCSAPRATAHSQSPQYRAWKYHILQRLKSKLCNATPENADCLWFMSMAVSNMHSATERDGVVLPMWSILLYIKPSWWGSMRNVPGWSDSIYFWCKPRSLGTKQSCTDATTVRNLLLQH